MNLRLPLITLAAEEYNCGAYGAGAYNENQCATASTGGDGLPGTGYDILIPLALGISIVVASVILLIKRIRRNRSHA